MAKKNQNKNTPAKEAAVAKETVAPEVTPVEQVEETPVVEATPEVVIEAIEEAPKPTKAAEAKEVSVVSEVTEKMVLCRGLKSHSCTVVKETYNVAKGTDIKLPSSVATILSLAGAVVKR